MQSNHHRSSEKKVARYGWLTTFNDMITLLMVFFVLLFSMGSLDLNQFKHFQNALQSAMGILHSGQHAPVGIVTKDESKPSVQRNSDRYEMNENVKMHQLENTKGLEAEYTKRGIHLTLDDHLLFKSGSALLTPKGVALLNRVAAIIRPLNRLVRVEGHTDDVPIANDDFPSNWELSTDRAVSVVKYLQTEGKIPANLLSAAGYGSSKPRVLNDSDKNRSKNRRVEIILQQQMTNQIENRSSHTYGGNNV